MSQNCRRANRHGNGLVDQKQTHYPHVTTNLEPAKPPFGKNEDGLGQYWKYHPFSQLGNNMKAFEEFKSDL